MLDTFYPDDIKTSMTYLRRTLQQIGLHKLPYTPVVYMVWYAYTSGRQPDLNKAIDAKTKNGESVTYDDILEWFNNFLADQKTLLAEKKTREFMSIIAETSKNLQDSGSKMSLRENRIEGYTERITPAIKPDQMKNLSAEILVETRSILKENQDLKKEMDDTVSEIDALKAELEGLKQTARTDPLTGLLNRRGLDDAAARAMKNARERNMPLTVILCDIDHFKRVNDTHGHLIGDNVLCILARLLKEQIKGKDIAARFGGEEFLLMLADTGLDGGFALAEQIRKSLETIRWRAKNSRKNIGPITISLGVATYNRNEPIDLLFQRADKALYQAKTNGRNQTRTEQDLKYI